MEGEGVVYLTAVLDKDAPYRVGFQTELACYWVVWPVELGTMISSLEGS